MRVLRHGTIDHGKQFLSEPTVSVRQLTLPAIPASGLRFMRCSARVRCASELSGSGPVPSPPTGARGHLPLLRNQSSGSESGGDGIQLSAGLPAQHDVVLGDARLMLERQPGQHFDLLVVDAFSGDAIPVHLLTREAWALYWRHLKPDGVLAVHVSNGYLNLAPVVALGAAETGKRAMKVSYDGSGVDEESASDWVLVSPNPGFSSSPS